MSLGRDVRLSSLNDLRDSHPSIISLFRCHFSQLCHQNNSCSSPKLLRSCVACLQISPRASALPLEMLWRLLLIIQHKLNPRAVFSLPVFQFQLCLLSIRDVDLVRGFAAPLHPKRVAFRVAFWNVFACILKYTCFMFDYLKAAIYSWFTTVLL